LGLGLGPRLPVPRVHRLLPLPLPDLRPDARHLLARPQRLGSRLGRPRLRIRTRWVRTGRVWQGRRPRPAIALPADLRRLASPGAWRGVERSADVDHATAYAGPGRLTRSTHQDAPSRISREGASVSLGCLP
jgi:hypothetical protein